MGNLLENLAVGIAVVLLFGASIFAHELGHYWMALWRRMKVESFAIGFGPKIYSTIQNGIEYSIRWIPAGGFVKLPQMVTSEALEGASSVSAENLPPASPLSKSFVALAGPAMNVVLAFVVATAVYFTGLPVPVNPPIIGYVPADSEEARLGIKPGDRIVAIDNRSIASWQDVMNYTVLSRSNMFLVNIERQGTRNTYRLEGKTDNPLGLKMLNLDPLEHPVVGTVEPGKPAEKAGLRPADKFISFASVPVFGHEQLVELIGKRAGQPSEMVIERQGERIKMTITPIMDKALKRGRIGISFGSMPLQYEVVRPGPTPWAHMAEVWDKTMSVLGALVHSKQTGVGVKDLSGPPGILAMLAIHVKTDYRLALAFLVLLNVNLAVLNLLPVPVLDGGHIVLAALERIRRRPLSVRLIEYVNTVFAVLLITLIVYVSFNDIRRMPRFKEVFQRSTTVEQSPRQPSQSPAPAPAK